MGDSIGSVPGAEVRLLFILLRCAASAADTSGLPAYSEALLGDKKPVLCRWKPRVLGEAATPAVGVLIPSDAILASSCSPTALFAWFGDRKAPTGSLRAICWSTVMKKRICTCVDSWSRLYSAAVRSASLSTRNHCSMALSSSLKFWSSDAAAISSSVAS